MTKFLSFILVLGSIHLSAEQANQALEEEVALESLFTPEDLAAAFGDEVLDGKEEELFDEISQNETSSEEVFNK